MDRGYCTATATSVEWEVVPSVAVTVTLYVPAGVPELLLLELPLLPPHPMAAVISATVRSVNAIVQRRFRAGIPSTNIPAIRAPLLPIQNGAELGLSPAWVAVVTVRVTVPLVVVLLSATGLPLIEHPINAVEGAEQVKLTEPV